MTLCPPKAEVTSSKSCRARQWINGLARDRRDQGCEGFKRVASCTSPRSEEQQPSKLKVAGSNPAGVANDFNGLGTSTPSFPCRNVAICSRVVSTVYKRCRRFPATWMRHRTARIRRRQRRDRATKWVSIASRRHTRIDAGHETPSPRHLSPASFLARVGIRIDQVPGLRFDRPHDRLDLAVAELIEIVRLHVLELRPDLARLRPLAILGK